MNDSSKTKRPGSWEVLQSFADPDSNITVVIYQRIRGRPAYSIQLVHTDTMGANKYIEVPTPKAKHHLEDIVFSLCKTAREYIEKLQDSGDSSTD